MATTLRSVMVASVLLVATHDAAAQTVDEIIEKHLAALGGRASISKLKSRSTTGTITLSTPGGDVSGSIEVLNQAPNKVRTLINVDLTALGAGPLVIDQRFDGKSGYVLDSLQGNRDITGNQLDNMRNAAFPTAMLNYKTLGLVATLAKEKVGDRDAYVLSLDPPSGSIVRHFIDAETFLPIMTMVKVDVPQVGREVEQTTEYADFRVVDGVKTPFRITSTSAVQRFTIEVTKVEHNVSIDETLFLKPR